MVFSIPHSSEINETNILQSVKQLADAVQAISDSTSMADMALADKIVELKHSVDTGFHEVNQRLGKMDQRFEKMDQRFEKMDQRFEKMESRLESVENKIDQTREETVELLKQIAENTKR